MISYRFGKQVRLLALAALFLAPFWAWGQTGLSGVYYIANYYQYSSTDHSACWYMVPAKDPVTDTYEDAYYSSNYNTQLGDPEKPFMTTYQTNRNDNDTSIWVLQEVEGESGFYYMIHAMTGKYLVYEPPFSNATNRKSVHLQVDPILNDSAKFAITGVPNGANDWSEDQRLIRIKKLTTGNRYLNPAGDNANYYHANSNGSSPFYYLGLVGVYSEYDGTGNNIGRRNSRWYLENTLMTAPIIDVDEATNTFTIRDANGLPEGYTIRYTTNGTSPTATEGNIYSGPISVTASWTVRAVVVRYGLVLTEVAERNVSPLIATPIISFDNSTNKVSISCNTLDADIYYNTGDGSQADPTTGSTPYIDPFDVNSPTTVKAIASLSGFGESSVASLVITQVATPTIQNNGNNAISITSATEGATIYYTTDGNAPTTTSSPVYMEPLTENVSNVTIKAIAVKENMITSAVGSGSVTLQCDAPVITRNGNAGFIATCSFPNSVVTIYYTTGDGTQADPTTSSSSIPSGVSVAVSLPITVKAMAVASNYSNSSVTTVYLTQGMGGNGTAEDPYTIEYQSDVVDFIDKANTEAEASKCYKVISTDPLDFSGAGVITQPFSGSFDGNCQTLTGLTHPLFNTVDGGAVKNVTLKNVNISSSEAAVGAIAGTAKGYSRIYNCGILPNSADFPDGPESHPIVSTTGACAGGIVGNLEDDSRVINCYSYADVSATTTASGIVGYNNYASTAAESDGKYANLRTAIVNCMFYGDILGGTNQYGVYGGELITNAAATGISSYNYYRYGSTFTTSSTYGAGEPTAYNCSFPADVRYLTQVEFHRSLLNSNRELCGWWVGSDVAPSTLTTTEVQAIPKDASLMYKWVVDPNLAPYPILKPFGKYPSVVNGNTGTPWFDRTTANPYQGKQLGTLTVTVKSGTHSDAADKVLTIPITDMDTLHYDFGYYKVQLPYFNTVFGDPEGEMWAVKYAGNYTDSVVTGWKVINVDHKGTNQFEPHWEHGYNFADRKCTDKDLYSVSGRVFAQGGNYYVPDGVTAITIEAYWGKAIYVCDDNYSYDRVNITEGNTGDHFAPAGTRNSQLNGSNVYKTKIRDVIDNITVKKTVYDHAIVLVGNVQESNSDKAVTVNTDKTIGFTIMSVDLDFDEEPDYCLEWQLGTGTNRNAISPARFDFLPVVELGIAGKLNDSRNFFSLGCFRSCGHFEVTETAFIRFGQFEFERNDRDEGPVILNGGIYDQYTRGTKGAEQDNNIQHITYVILGGHVVMPSFTPGAHVNGNAAYTTRHCAVNALGGDFSSFYLTGGYNEKVIPFNDNPHCYIDGGRFGTIAAAYKEGIAGNVTWRINHALIGEFYGGGVMSQADGNYYKIVKGNIDVVIDNSIVGKYCGGPKFGNMMSGTTVNTRATGTVFGHYYGAGNGGTNYVQYDNTDNVAAPYPVETWNSTVRGKYHPAQYRGSSATTAPNTYEADYEYELINTSTGTTSNQVVNRCYYYSAQFATTNTGDVTSSLTNCTVKNNFYGAGFLGGVTGSVTSTLTDTRVMGSVYGAGYSAASGTVTIHYITKNPPVANVYTGMITYNPGGTSTTYTWTHDSGSTSDPVTGDSDELFYTEVPLDNLGAVQGNVILTIEGQSVVGTEGDTTTGNVFGGGEASAVNGNITVILQDDTHVVGNVFGGGDQGKVEGNTEVKIIQPIPDPGSGEETQEGH